MTLLDKLCSEWNKVDKPTIVPIIYEESDDEEVVMVWGNKINNNHYNKTVSDFKSEKKNKTFCQTGIIRLAIGTAQYLNWDNTSP